MQLDKFTIKSQEAIQRAQQLAMDMEHQAIECGHLLLFTSFNLLIVKTTKSSNPLPGEE